MNDSDRPIIHDLDERYMDYLSDESGLTGKAGSISFPTRESEIQQILSEKLIPVTIQGSRTGLTGSAVPATGHIMNLSNMSRITGLKQDKSGQFLIRVQPGIRLCDLEEQLYNQTIDTSGWDQKFKARLDRFYNSGRWFWPVNPTESNATIGGIVSQGACGSLRLGYGCPIDHISQIRFMDASGRVNQISKDEYRIKGNFLPLPENQNLILDPLMDLGDIPEDLLDICLGSEGMLGVITELTLGLRPRPEQIWGVSFFFREQNHSLEFVQQLNRLDNSRSDARIVGMEWVGVMALESVKKMQSVKARLKTVPVIPPEAVSAVLVDIHGNDSEAMDDLAEMLMSTAIEQGGDDRLAWAFCNPQDLDRFNRLSHALIESAGLIMNQKEESSSGLYRLAFDICFDPESMIPAVQMIREILSKYQLKASLFGPVCTGRIYVHLLTESKIQKEQMRKLFLELSDISKLSVNTGYGWGKTKGFMLAGQNKPDTLKFLYQLKQVLDPMNVWNPGNMNFTLD